MSQIHKHDIPANIADRCLINPEQYHEKYQQSITAPDTFWGEQGHILDWIKPYQKVKNTSFAPGNVSIKWYEDGTLNLAANYTLLVQDQGTAATAAANLLAANTGEITWFQYGGDTYVVAMVNDTGVAVQQTALDANDIVVKLVGLHDLTGANFNAGGEHLMLA